MGGKVMIDGTVRNIAPYVQKIDGTNRVTNKGQTIINGTKEDITFGLPIGTQWIIGYPNNPGTVTEMDQKWTCPADGKYRIWLHGGGGGGGIQMDSKVQYQDRNGYVITVGPSGGGGSGEMIEVELKKDEAYIALVGGPGRGAQVGGLNHVEAYPETKMVITTTVLTPATDGMKTSFSGPSVSTSVDGGGGSCDISEGQLPADISVLCGKGSGTYGKSSLSGPITRKTIDLNGNMVEHGEWDYIVPGTTVPAGGSGGCVASGYNFGKGGNGINSGTVLRVGMSASNGEPGGVVIIYLGRG